MTTILPQRQQATASRRGDPRPRLSDRVVQALRDEIAAGALAPGARLPTEGQLCEMYGVSRTVVREAVTRLAADGLVTPRQGAGIFVNDSAQSSVATLIADLGDKVSMVLNVLEVRMAVEIEAAALAAQRRSSSQEGALLEAFNAFEGAMRDGQGTGAADFLFHRAVAEATNNPFYVEILDILGRRTIPRELVSVVPGNMLQSQEYYEKLHREHQDIMNAITDGDSDSARDAMRRHLAASRRRYHALLREGSDLTAAFEPQT